MPANTSTAIAIRAIVARPLRSSVFVDSPRSASDEKNSNTNRKNWTMKPDTESITPAEIAVDGPTPQRWKKRTLIATRAAVLGIARLT